MRRSSMALIAGLLAASSGCRHPQTEIVPISERVFVVVANNFSQQMEILVVASGATQRLGVVNPSMEARFEVPPGMIGSGPVSFLAHPTADARQVARPGEVLLSRGQTVEFIIGNPLFNSTVTVRR